MVRLWMEYVAILVTQLPESQESATSGVKAEEGIERKEGGNLKGLTRKMEEDVKYLAPVSYVLCD
jgi:hypothetical protein